jgi:hypothetical protein
MLGAGGGQSPKFFKARIWLAFCALRVRVGLVWLLVWSWKRDLHRGLEPGKFEKLLRSDPRLSLVVVVPGVSVV